jgi:error-prone DNA polymerase
MYAELHAHSAFSFLEGASLPEQLAERAGDLAYAALALTDRDDFGGQVRFLEAAERVGVRPILGAEITVRRTPLLEGVGDGQAPPGRSRANERPSGLWSEDFYGLVLLVEDARGYANLATLVSKGRFERPRGTPYVTLEEVAERSAGLVALTAFLEGPLAPALRRGDVGRGARFLQPWLEIFGDRLYLEVQDHDLPEERAATKTTFAIAAHLGLDGPGGRVVATNHVHHVTRELKPVEDVLRAIKHECTIDAAGDRLFPNDERYLRAPQEMLRRFRACPEVVKRSLEIAERCGFTLRDLVAPLPCFPVDEESVPSAGLAEHPRRPHPPGPPLPRERADELVSRARAGEGGASTAEERGGVRSAANREEVKSSSIGIGADGLVIPGVERILGHDRDAELEALTWEGAKTRYGTLLELPKYRDQLLHELSLIRRMKFAGYFLILWDIVREAKRRRILVQGRGSAANSAVCYSLGITAIDPIGRALLFERFLSEGRSEPPDIDLDIEHERREELLQYVYTRYGRDHAAMVAAVHTFQPKQAAKDVARVLGMSPQQGNALASLCDRFVGMDGWHGSHKPTPDHKTADELRGGYMRVSPDRLKDAEAMKRSGLDPSDKRVSLVPWLVERMVGLPRHRAIHTGGFVLSEKPIFEVCPVEWASMPGRTILQWEKDDLGTLGLVKFDLLGLGMLTVLRMHLDLVEQHRGERLDLWQLPHDDPEVYDAICAADTVGVFQIESRAQMNTLPRLRPRQFYDLVVEVALIRPGPIQGEMVHPYLRRRIGSEPVTYLHPSLEPHLARTLGIPLFQEQGMRVAIEIGGFSPSEADELRRAMGHKRSRAKMDVLADKLRTRMGARGLDLAVAERIVKQLSAFADYGFPESHAASFALLVYASAFLRWHYMPEFYAAILNAQPMGFYSPASLVEDAKRHGVVVRPPDVSCSTWDCTIEDLPPQLPRVDEVARCPICDPGDACEHGAVQVAPATEDARVHPFAMRVGLRYVRGLGGGAREAIERAITPRPRSIVDFAERAGLPSHVLLAMASAGTFDSLEPDRRRAVWEILRVGQGRAGPLDLPGIERESPELPRMTPAEELGTDYARLGLSTRDHPMRLLRGELDARGVTIARALAATPRKQVKIAGVVICRQRPPTAKGFVFLTLEDETGMVNVVVEPALFDRTRRDIVGHAALEIDGALERQDGVVNVKAMTVRPLALPWTDGLRSRDFH